MFQSIEQWIKRSDVKANRAARALIDKFADFVAVAWTGFNEREDEKFGAAFFPFGLEGRFTHIWHCHILNACEFQQSSECFETIAGTS